MIKEWDNSCDNVCSGQACSVSQIPEQYFRNKSLCSSPFSLDHLSLLFLYCHSELCSHTNNSYCDGTLHFCQTFQPKMSKHYSKLLILLMFPAEVLTQVWRSLFYVACPLLQGPVFIMVDRKGLFVRCFILSQTLLGIWYLRVCGPLDDACLVLEMDLPSFSRSSSLCCMVQKSLLYLPFISGRRCYFTFPFPFVWLYVSENCHGFYKHREKTNPDGSGIEWQQVRRGKWAENRKEYAHFDCLTLQAAEWEEARDKNKSSYLVG